ncbi:hypothetical protein DSO57_1025434 [Entomophthora muscae]|uniref:Uncharacterized protein n=1 Tax=Entomophthora muscae TaxID=34485 RepID=A0ACC2SS15_9FUNG|nr:hypothetical protein DSO57_1025434 [Entomophthora muscae]
MSFTNENNFDIVKEQYQELIQAQATDQGSATTVFPVYTQFNASCEEAEFYVSSDPSMGGFSDSQYGVPQDQAQPVPVPHSGDWATVDPSNQIRSSLESLGQSEQALPNPSPLIPEACQKCQIITNEIIEEIVSPNQNGVSFAKIATWLQFTEAVIKPKFWALLKRGGTKLVKKPKKQANSQIKEVYPLMLALLQQDPYIQLTEVCCLLGLQGIFIASRTAQLWMHGLLVSVLIMINWLSDELYDGSDLPHGPVIGATLTCCLSSILDNVVFISYYELSLQFHDYGILSEKNALKGKKKEVQGKIIGTFLAVSLKETLFYRTTTSYTNGYWYRKFLSDLLTTWSSANSKFQIFLSHQIKCTEVASKKIEADSHKFSIFPAGHADLHLGDVVKIDNSSPLETQAREWDSNPGPGSLWTAGPPTRVFWGSNPCKLRLL